LKPNQHPNGEILKIGSTIDPNFNRKPPPTALLKNFAFHYGRTSEYSIRVHPVFAYLDYRAYLRAFHEERKKSEPGFSQRLLAQRIGVDAGQLVRILQGKNHLATKFVAPVAELCEMDDRAAAYFEELLRYSAIKTNAEAERCMERLQALRGVATSSVQGSQADYYSDWKHAVVRAILGLGAWKGQPENLGQHCLPALTGDEIKTSLDLLQSLQLIACDEDGTWHLTDAHISPGGDIPVPTLRQYHTQVMELAKSAIFQIDAAERDFGCVTISVDESGLERMRELSRELRRRIQSLSQSTSNPDRIYQLNLQTFPVASWNQGVLA
jgi:uncharacterized protein (TIGR02147 family)